MEINNIIFFNHFHNGDIHLSKNLINHIIDAFPNIKCHYSHGCSNRLLLDKPNVPIINTAHGQLNPHLPGILYANNTLFVNTWVGCDNGKFLANGCIYPSLYEMFNYYCTVLNINPLGPIENYIPTIDFSYYNVETINNHFNSTSANKNIFIVNGNCYSGQDTNNFDFTTLIRTLAENKPNYNFYISNNNFNLDKPANVFLTDDIIDKDIIGNNLNENAYITKFCDIIIGRPTGAYTYSLNKQNFKEKKTYICLIDRNYSFNGFDQIITDSEFKIISDTNTILNII